MSWFIKCLKQYVDFKGRARRKEYWYFVLFYFIIRVISCILDSIFNTQIYYSYFNSYWFNVIVYAFPTFHVGWFNVILHSFTYFHVGWFFIISSFLHFNSGWFNIIVDAFLMLPSFAVIVRRLHDVNKSVWFLVILYALLGVYLFSAMRYIANPVKINIIIFTVTYFVFWALGIWFIVLMCFNSVPGVNKWGPNPKGVGNHVCEPEVISNVENIE